MSATRLEGRKILITGSAGQIAFPMARELARRNEVWGIARFSDPDTRRGVEAAGIHTLAIDLARPDFSELPAASPTCCTSPPRFPTTTTTARSRRMPRAPACCSRIAARSSRRS